MSEIANMTNEELLREYESYDEMIHGRNACFGVKDVAYFYALENECARREE